ncbi:hypothetical protein I4U23_015539 [Adineta vaga]|nr:hypothetical protein I4U23_015539 [Adineta vaga]
MKFPRLITILLIVCFFCSIVYAEDTSSSNEDEESGEVSRRNVGLKRELLIHRRDNQGCDAMVRSCGKNGRCCDYHDACYKKHKCTALSWFYLWGNCVKCNNEVMACIVAKNPGKSSCCVNKNCGTKQK